MENFDLTLSLNGEEIPIKVNTSTTENKTIYNVFFENYSVTIYKNTLYT